MTGGLKQGQRGVRVLDAARVAVYLTAVAAPKKLLPSVDRHLIDGVDAVTSQLLGDHRSDVRKDLKSVNRERDTLTVVIHPESVPVLGVAIFLQQRVALFRAILGRVVLGQQVLDLLEVGQEGFVGRHWELGDAPRTSVRHIDDLLAVDVITDGPAHVGVVKGRLLGV